MQPAVARRQPAHTARIASCNLKLHDLKVAQVKLGRERTGNELGEVSQVGLEVALTIVSSAAAALDAGIGARCASGVAGL